MDRVRLIPLASGPGRPLYVVPGAGGEAEELRRVADGFGDVRPVIAVEVHGCEVEPTGFDGVADQADRVAAAILREQPGGPYQLLGYSFGGLLVLDIASRLQASGAEVAFTGLVDTIYDRRFWPSRLFAVALLRRTARHLSSLARRPRREAVQELSYRSGRMAHSIRSRWAAPDVDEGPRMGDQSSRERANLAAAARWQPRTFDHHVWLFTSEGAGDFGCDPAQLWAPWLHRLTVARLPGDHLGLVRERESAARVAAEVESVIGDLGVGRRPRALVVSTFTWSTAGRLAVALDCAGFDVHAVAPRRSVISRLTAVGTTHTLGVIRPLRDLRHALEESAPDLIVPCDDPSRQALHRLHAGTDVGTARGRVVAKSLETALGAADVYSQLYCRQDVMDIARKGGLRVPDGVSTPSLENAQAWFATRAGPAVMKTDGSWGGREVRVVHDPAEVESAWHQLTTPPSPSQIVKRLIVDRDPWPLRDRTRQRRPAVSIQDFVSGRPATASVACLDGDVLAPTMSEVVVSTRATGPSTVLRVVDHPEMEAAVAGMVKVFRLSGLVGFDFVVEDATGHAYLIELNPRATQTSHLHSAAGIDPLSTLKSALCRGNAPPPTIPPYPEGLVALFPQEMRRDPNSPYLLTAFHDVPWDAPDYVARVTRERRTMHTLAARRHERRIQQWESAQRTLNDTPGGRRMSSQTFT